MITKNINTNVNTYLDMLGRNGEDRVTGFKGIATSLYFDLYGCIQVVLCPPIGEDGKKKESAIFDVSRIVISGPPVMEQPDWISGPVSEGKHGPAEKPGFE